MMGRPLNVEKDSFRPKEENEKDLGTEVPYLGALMYLANCYLSDPHNGKSQTGYVFTYGDTAISWKF
ncbi:hypothetical protein LIER_09901 [Lithospermum erythrorhizon]|uniref:Uncharacterized protein n=1 Tax=Lithospermum erythrorhizon TaxID=34254 RepID=A0AAV3PIM0_LITER